MLPQGLTEVVGVGFTKSCGVVISATAYLSRLSRRQWVWQHLDRFPHQLQFIFAVIA
jgi:uncharacterized membrane protein SpoIIM required for sporulation